jgi:hypothetical protein
MKETIITIILTIIGSSALWQTVTFLITRADSKKNNPIYNEIKKVSDKVDQLSDKVDENQAILARTHILRFSDELKNGVVHSEEYFRQQLDDCDTYDRYCDAHPEFKNSYTLTANKHIKDSYEKLIKEGKL